MVRYQNNQPKLLQRVGDRRKIARRTLSVETLEPRLALDAAGALPAIDPNLTISFAPDGTEIADDASSLMARFDSVSPRVEWQTAIVKAFQTWAIQTNVNVGVTTDQGDAFGISGSTVDDERFGDIRVGARPLDPGVAAISVPLTSVASGSWLGDVVFNSEFDFQTVDDIFAVSLHEAGNVFGLADSNDSNSPLFSGGIPTATWPTTADITALQAIHGDRSVDSHEVDADGESQRTDNNSFGNATPLEFPEFADVAGAAPVIVYGDLRDGIDLDHYLLKVPGDYSGSLTVELRTSGFSALVPELSVYNQSLQLVGQTASSSPLSGSNLAVRIQTGPDDEFYLRVSPNTPDVFDVGGYSLVAVLDQINQISLSEIDTLADGRYARLHPEELVKLYASDDEFLAEDEQEDDDINKARELSSDASFASGTRYQSFGSISTASDQDVFKVKAPQSSSQTTMRVSVRSLDAGRLIPDVTIYDEDENELAGEIVGNGGGVVTVQVQHTTPEKEYFVAVRAASNWLFQTGDYEMSVEFSANTIVLEEVISGSVDSTFNRNEHTLYIARPQIFHFVFDAASATTIVTTAIRLQIVDGEQNSRFVLATLPGQTRSAESVLLLPGSYTVIVDSVTANQQPPASVLEYSLRGTPVSDPLAIELDGGIDAPFDCPDPINEGAFCYPNGVITSQPSTWDSLIIRLFSSDQPQGEQLNSLLHGDWWSWYWTADGTAGAPTASADTYQLNSNATLVATAEVGLLSNDVDPEGQQVLAVMETPPLQGTLELSADGSFTYVPSPAFEGIDQFTYRAFDLGKLSEAVTVSLEVFAAGDFDYSGEVDAPDIDALSQAIADNVDEARFDLNNDSQVDLHDHTYLVMNILSAFPGDVNLDGRVDATDLTIWQNHRFSMSVGWAEGDFNADRVTDGSDFNLWNVHKFMDNRAAAFTFTRRPQSPLADRAEPAVVALDEAPIPGRSMPETVSRWTAGNRLPTVGSLHEDSSFPRRVRNLSKSIGRRTRPSQERNYGDTNINSLPGDAGAGDSAAGNIDGLYHVYFVTRKARDRN